MAMAQGIGPRVRSVIPAAVLVAALLLPLVANAAIGPGGTWIGKMKTSEGKEFDLTLVLDGAGTSWSGELRDPFMGTLGLENLKVTATRVGFTFRPGNSPIQGNFSGTYLAAKDRITGTFSLRGTSRFVKFERSPDSLGLGPAAAAEPAEPVRVRHDYRFAATGRVAWWPSLHVVKDETYNLNNMTAAAPAFDLAVKWFPLDGFNVFARYFRGGQNYTDSSSRLGQFPDLDISSDTYLELDGWEIGVMGYLGSVMMPESRFNPYLTGAVGLTSWALASSGRGSDPVVLERTALEGTDPAIMAGIGTEYELSQRMVLELEWAWRFFMTKDEQAWPEPGTTWSNTHAWCLSAGLTFGF
jgi:opacity protein-like surface antigen